MMYPSRYYVWRLSKVKLDMALNFFSVESSKSIEEKNVEIIKNILFRSFRKQIEKMMDARRYCVNAYECTQDNRYNKKVNSFIGERKFIQFEFHRL